MKLLTQIPCSSPVFIDGTADWPPPLAEKFQGDASNTYTCPQNQECILQGMVAAGGASRTELGGRIDVLASRLFIRHISITGQHAISQSYYEHGHKAGGAIFVYQGEIHVEHVQFVNNDADDEGGAIMAYFAVKVAISDSEFTGNHVNDAAGGDTRDGGAIYLDLTEDTTIERTAFNDNTADSGGAVYVQTGSRFRQAILSDCSGTGNWATDGCGGNAPGTIGTASALCSPLKGTACETTAGCGWDGLVCLAAGSNGEVDHSCSLHGCVVYWTGSQSRCLNEAETIIPMTIEGQSDLWGYISLGASTVGPGSENCGMDPLPFDTTGGTCSDSEIPTGPADGQAGSCAPECRLGHSVLGEAQATCMDETDISSVALGRWMGRCGPPLDPDEDLTDCANIHVISHACCPDNPTDCDTSFPKSCADDCAISMDTFWHNCADLLRQIPGLTTFMAKCLDDPAELAPGGGH